MGLPSLEGPSSFTSNRGLALDDALWSGRVTRTDDTMDDTRAIRAHDEKLHADERITMSMLPIGHGLTLVRKRSWLSGLFFLSNHSVKLQLNCRNFEETARNYYDGVNIYVTFYWRLGVGFVPYSLAIFKFPKCGLTGFPMFRKLLFLPLLCLSFAFPATLGSAETSEGSNCGQRNTVLDYLSAKYSEKPVAMGIAANGGLIEVLTSREGSTFTIIVTMPKGETCMVAAGESWESLPNGLAKPQI